MDVPREDQDCEDILRNTPSTLERPRLNSQNVHWEQKVKYFLNSHQDHIARILFDVSLRVGSHSDTHSEGGEDVSSRSCGRQ